MDKTLTKDARGFIDGVVSMLKSDRKSAALAPKVQHLLGKMTIESKRNSLAVVSTSIPLEKDEKLSLEKALGEALGRHVELNVRVEPKLIAGIRVQVGDWVLDTSIAGQLSRLSESLMEGEA